MIKCEVLVDTVIGVKKGSLVIVSEKQYELSRAKLKPVDVKKEVEVKQVETREEKPVEELVEQPKKKQNRKK